MKIEWSVSILLAVFVVCGSGTVKGQVSHATEQLHFSARDDGAIRPVTIPEDVLAILRKDDMVRIILKDENLPEEKLPPSWFSASAIHLNTSNEIDLIVIGETPILGANVTTFWVFRPTSHGHELVLTAPALDLVVKRARWMGYREIELMAATASDVSTVLYRFNGKQYAAFKERSEQIH
jgi:hypothetical protein